MDIAFHIPTWLMWVGGILAGIIVIVLAFFGVMFVKLIKDMGGIF